MTAAQLQILQHSLGVDQYGRGRQYRNHFVTEPASSDGAICESLVACGLMRREDNMGELTGGMPCYHVTKLGVLAVQAESPSPPKKTRAQERYDRWLTSASDCMSFRDWLKRKEPA